MVMIVMKRFFDVVLSLVGGLLLLPVFVVVVILVKLRVGSPVFFRQKRPGLHGKEFTMIKFRTMSNRKGENGALLPDEMRLVPFGSWLRSTSLDELPELINVIKGDMSLVGPRPLLCEYLPLYSDRQLRRHEVRPGITGWAQINGRNALSWDEKFELDVWYVENRTLWLDIKILFLTVMKVVRRDGINNGDDVTMPRFTGGNRSD